MVRGEFMMANEKTSLVLMVQSSRRIFCYFNISPSTIKEFKEKYGENLWESSRPALKVYLVEEGIAKDIKTILIDDVADNWYIDMEQDDVDIFVELGRVLEGNTFVLFAISNTITTPRDHGAEDNSVYFVDISKIKEKAYSYPKIIIGERHYNNHFIDEYFDKMIKKYTLNSSQMK